MTSGWFFAAWTKAGRRGLAMLVCTRGALQNPRVGGGVGFKLVLSLARALRAAGVELVAEGQEVEDGQLAIAVEVGPRVAGVEEV